MPTSHSKATKKSTRSAPWERPAPAKVARKRPTKLTPAQKAHAKTRAKKAGRHYPNLVDNMHEAEASKKKSTRTRTPRKKAAGSASATKRKSTTRRATKRKGTTRKSSPRRAPTKRTTKRATKRAAKRTGTKAKKTRDPRGGLTAAGRAEFARKDGSHLKPGVTKTESEMSPEEMRRKGSWAVRFYGRQGTLPPLADAHGHPTRFALTAAAWGEPVPKTVRAARAIATKGRRLLARAKREQA